MSSASSSSWETPPASASSQKPKAKAKPKAANKDKEDDKEVNEEEELLKHGPLKLKAGTWVEIFGLESGDGKKLNGQKGPIVQYIYEKIRYEVSLGVKTVSVRPVNLREAEKPDKSWKFGNMCRLVCLRDVEDEGLRAKSGMLGTLMFPSKNGAWKVEVQDSLEVVNCEHLRVCTEDDKRGLYSLHWVKQGILWVAAAATVLLVGIALLVAVSIGLPHLDYDDSDDEFQPGGFLLKPLPNPDVGKMCLIVVIGSCLWIWGTLISCAKMHRSLWDPQTAFPQVAELSLSTTSARMLYRYGLGAAAALNFVAVLLHKQLVLPHLSPSSSQAEDVLFWGACAAAGLASQAAVLVETRYTWHTLLQRIGGLCLLYSLYSYGKVLRPLYFPGVHFVEMFSREWFGLENPFEESEGDVLMAAHAQEETKTVESEFLKQPGVVFAVIARYEVLSRWPWALLCLPIFYHITESVPENSKVAPATLARSMYAWLQWFLVVYCTLLYLSYGADLYVAANLPKPTVVEN
eukprot:TRINITY_DN91457_c0_g1_i1.p1 TRINITY_DN91457_c0_g1~~TRINITY_DN91457_c0_g1_i1.p1  ORF type:complete len:540 (-),score=101.37 TRINITY_DN91457_c0_g1_i1:8-1561(-)